MLAGRSFFGRYGELRGRVRAATSPIGGISGAGQGGSGNVAGTSSGGTAAITPCSQQPTGATVTASYTVTLDGGVTETLTSCYVTMANYLTNPVVQASCNYTAQSNDGYITVGINVAADSSGSGYLATAGVALSQQTIPTRIQGSYSEAEALPVGSGCVAFSTLEMMHGGRLVGTVDCTVMGGNDTAPLSAHITGSFDCRFAP